MNRSSWSAAHHDPALGVLGCGVGAIAAIAAIACGSTSPEVTNDGDGAGAGAEASGSMDSAKGPDGALGDGGGNDAAKEDGARGDSGAQDAATEDVVSGDAAGTTIAMEVTFYGWADNSPPGNAIAYPANAGQPTIHNVAGGTGTYADPITFATAPTEFSPGTRLYVPFIEKYVVMEDSCGQCTTDWMSRAHHIDLWMNSNGTETASALMNCEGAWTRTQTNVETNPPATRTVTTAPLFDPATNTCRTSP
jgi:3D (Asp-Asp-Asp) domain-containing protein